LSGAGSQPAPSLAPQFPAQGAQGTIPQGRSPLAHLLHALNQPLTGLQCSLELAVAGPRPTEQYVRALREGLELTGRMRILVEAIREVADTQPSDPEELEPLLLDQLVRSTVTELLPVAEAKKVRLVLERVALRNPLPGNRLPENSVQERLLPDNQAALLVRADRRSLATLLFRFLESTLSLARDGSELRITATSEPENATPGHAILVVCWNPGPPPEHSPFSRSEVGLLIARAGWERAGAEWIHTRTESIETCTIRLPLAPPFAAR
jgi:signal transduction histidine kinase